jgi:carboxypeptidase T
MKFSNPKQLWIRGATATLILGSAILFSGSHPGSQSILLSRSDARPELRFIQVQAADQRRRSQIVNLGMSIEFVRSDSVWGFATTQAIRQFESSGFSVLGVFDPAMGRGGHMGSLDFPAQDARFRNNTEMLAFLKNLNMKHADITRIVSIGKSFGGKDIWALQINSTPEALMDGLSQKPGIVYMGSHHAREHVSSELPAHFAEYLLKNRQDPKIANLIDTRDIWIIPTVNPDGKEYDIENGNYRFWRKNRRDNKDGTFGVDLNRNYGYQWGTGGSSKNPNDDTYMGLSPFSEPETIAIKDFVEARSNLKVLLSFHTFSELILYPWGHTDNPIANPRDRQVFETMAKTMSKWNGYKPEQSSDLYIASGDTTDWAYGTKGIFAFTFELSPSGGGFGGAGGFYPGTTVLDKVLKDNIEPCLYLLDLADDPYRVLNGPTAYLPNIIQPSVSPDKIWSRGIQL